MEVKQRNLITAIPTQYRGYTFRSRLEARWAYYFDRIGLEWVYEPEGWQLSDGSRYLPDFYLPQTRHWAEVKPQGGIDGAMLAKVAPFVRAGLGDLLLLEGPPADSNYWILEKIPELELQRCEAVLCVEHLHGHGVCSLDMWFTGRPYWKTEGRFYISTGSSAPFPHREACEVVDTRASEAASFKFERGHV